MTAKRKVFPAPPTGNIMTPSDITERLAQRGTARAILSKPKSTNVALLRREAATHKYRAGETVTLVPTRYGPNRHGRFEVTRLLPEEQGVKHYRLKSVTDGHERVAREDELV
jgi:hypothetical protein